MKDIFPLLLIVGGGGFLLFRSQIMSLFAGASSAATASAPASSAPAAPPSLIEPAVWQEIYTHASGDPAFINGGGLLNLWQWNWFFNQISHQTAPDPASIGYPGERAALPISFATYRGAMSSIGLGRVKASQRAWRYPA